MPVLYFMKHCLKFKQCNFINENGLLCSSVFQYMGCELNNDEN